MNFVLADIPGIIEGASEGVGLGHAFLRHIERTRLLIHVVDVSGIEGRNPVEDFDTINAELARYNAELASRPQLVAANKTDILQDEALYQAFRTEMEKRGYPVYEISAATGKGVWELMKEAYRELSKLPPMPVFAPEMDIDEPVWDEAAEDFAVSKDGAVYVVSGPWIEAVGGSVNF
jgi:GTP-binding protein